MKEIKIDRSFPLPSTPGRKAFITRYSAEQPVDFLSLQWICLFRVLQLTHKTTGLVSKNKRKLKLTSKWNADMYRLRNLRQIPMELRRILITLRISLSPIFIMDDILQFGLPKRTYYTLNIILDCKLKLFLMRIFDEGLILETTKNHAIALSLSKCPRCHLKIQKFYKYKVFGRKLSLGFINQHHNLELIIVCSYCYSYLKNVAYLRE